MARLAFTTIGVLYETRSHTRSRGFAERSPLVMKAVEASEGFIARSMLDVTTGYQSWGDMVRPGFVPPERVSNIAQTLSLWEDLESVYAFTYSAGIHTESLRLRHDWFHTPNHPNYAAWWVSDDHQPDLGEATRKLEALDANGSSPEAFNFQQPFDAQRRPARLDPAVVKAKASRNAAKHS
jgi:hypothetical protein